jgi:hypothetical protein
LPINWWGGELRANPKSSFRDAPLGAGPESITTIGSMDSGLAALRRPGMTGSVSVMWQNCLTGKSANSCPAPFEKRFLFSADPNHLYKLAPSCPERGALAIVTNVGMGCGGRGSGGRVRSRRAGSPVSDATARGRTALNPPSLKLRRTGTKPVEAFGADGRVRQNRVVLAPVAGVKPAEVFRPNRASINLQSVGDGDKTNSSPGRARHKP